MIRALVIVRSCADSDVNAPNIRHASVVKMYRFMLSSSFVERRFSITVVQISPKIGRRVLVPLGEGGPAKRQPDRAKPQDKGRMRANMRQNPHPALRATLSRRERDTPLH